MKNEAERGFYLTDGCIGDATTVPNFGTLMNLLGTTFHPSEYVEVEVYNPTIDCAKIDYGGTVDLLPDCEFVRRNGRRVLVKLD